MLKIDKVYISDFGGIDERTIDLGGRSAILTGRNGAGKTSVLEAIRAAFHGAKADRVRAGRDEAVIRIELTDGGVIERHITAKGKQEIECWFRGTKIKVSGKRLAEYSSTLQFDPLSFVSGDWRARRDLILRMCDIKVTEKDLEERIRPVLFDRADGIFDSMITELRLDYELHALDVLDSVYSWLYAARKDANAAASEALKTDMVDLITEQAELCRECTERLVDLADARDAFATRSAKMAEALNEACEITKDAIPNYLLAYAAMNRRLPHPDIKASATGRLFIPDPNEASVMWSIEALSESERLRMGMSLAVRKTMEHSLGVMLVDGAESLDGDNFEVLVGNAKREDGPQIIVAKVGPHGLNYAPISSPALTQELAVTSC